jgi:phosphoribosylanthranilate isomerase
VFVKICGVTDPADAEAVVAAGADAVGLNFASSRRRVSVARACEIAAAVPPGVLTVGVFRDHLAEDVIEVASTVGLDAVQLHGREPAATSRRVHAAVPVLIRALSASDPQLDGIDDHGADAVLLDAPVPGGGVPFDWALIGDLTARHRIILAGGLRPENVAEAVAAVRPWGVDVASGVESVPGSKDHDAVRRFVAEARAAAERGDPEHPPLELHGKRS